MKLYSLAITEALRAERWGDAVAIAVDACGLANAKDRICKAIRVEYSEFGSNEIRIIHGGKTYSWSPEAGLHIYCDGFIGPDSYCYVWVTRPAAGKTLTSF